MDIATLGLKVDANGAIKATKDLNAQLGGLGGTAKKAALALGAAFAGGAVFTKLLKETINQQNAFAQLENVVRSTGGAADRTTDELTRMASALQNVSVFGDDAVMSAQSLLLTFTQIKGDQFDAATRSTLDLAQAMGGDLKGAALQLGKALNDPATGITALTRSGVSFSAAQKKVIKDLTETGKVAEAQTLILKELEVQFGGSAAAARDTLGGALAGLRNAYGDLFEAPKESTKQFQAAIELLTSALVNLKAQLDDGEVFTKVARELGNLVNAVGNTAKVFKEYGTQIDETGNQLSGFADIAKGLGTLDLELVRKGIDDNTAATTRYAESVARVNDLLEEGRRREAASRRAPLSAEGASAIQRFTAPNTPAPIGPRASGGGSSEFDLLGFRVAQVTKSFAQLTTQAEETAGAVDSGFQKAALQAGLAVERQKALNAAFGQSDEAIAELNATLDLKAKLSQIDADFTGAQAMQLKVLAEALATAEKEQRALNNAVEQAARQKEFAAIRAANAKVEADAIKEVNEAIAALNTRRAEGKTFADRELQALDRQIALANASGTAVRELADSYLLADAQAAGLAAGLDAVSANLFAADFVAKSREVEALSNNTRDWADALAQVASAAAGIASVFGDVGRTIAAALGQTAQLATSLGRVQEAAQTKNDAGAAIGIGGALGGAGGIGSQVAAVSGILGAVGAVVSIGDALGVFGGKASDAAKEVDEASKRFAEGFRDFSRTALGVSTSVDADIQSLGRQYEELFADLVTKFGGINKALRSTDFARLASNLNFGLQRIATDFLATIDEAYNALTGRDDLNAIAKANKEYEERLQSLFTLQKEGIITQDEYNAAVLKAGDVLDLTVEKIQDSIARLNNTAIRDFGIRAQATFDPVGAAAAQFYADQADELFDAIESNLSDAAIEALKFAQALESIAFEAAQAEAALRITEGLIGRALNATGNTSAGELFTFDASQRQELADAILAGFNPTQLALLEFTQFAEREQFLLRREIEEQTRIIREAADAQIAAIDQQIALAQSIGAQEQARFKEQIESARVNAAATAAAFQSQIDAVRAEAKAQTDKLDEQIKAAREQSQSVRAALQVAQKQLAVSERAADALRSFSESLLTGEFSPLSPEAQLRETRGRFEGLASAAAGGDAGAAANLPNAARELLEASRAFNASNPDFVTDFDRVAQVTAQLAAQFGTQADAERQLVAAAEKTAAGIERTIQSLTDQKELIQETAQREIDVLTALKDAAAEASRLEIQTLQDFAEAARAGNEELIDKLQQNREDILAAAEEQIRLITNQLTEITQARIEAHEFYETFLELSGQSVATAQDTGRVQVEVAKDSLKELKTVVVELKTGFNELARELELSRRAETTGTVEVVNRLNLAVNRLSSIETSSRIAAATPVRR